MKKQLKAIHDSSSVSTHNSFKIKSEATYVTDIKEEPVYYGNNSTRRRFNNYKRGIVTRNSGNITVRVHNIKV